MGELEPVEEVVLVPDGDADDGGDLVAGEEVAVGEGAAGDLAHHQPVVDGDAHRLPVLPLHVHGDLAALQAGPAVPGAGPPRRPHPTPPPRAHTPASFRHRSLHHCSMVLQGTFPICSRIRSEQKSGAEQVESCERR